MEVVLEHCERLSGPERIDSLIIVVFDDVLHGWIYKAEMGRVLWASQESWLIAMP